MVLQITAHTGPLTEAFLLRMSAYFCRKGTRAEVGSVASSGLSKETHDDDHHYVHAEHMGVSGTACTSSTFTYR